MTEPNSHFIWTYTQMLFEFKNVMAGAIATWPFNHNFTIPFPKVCTFAAHTVRSNHHIQKIFAVFLLGVFILCNTPTKLLHTLFANHTDEPIELNAHSNTPVLHEAGIDCHCISNVVNSPYLFEYQPLVITQQSEFPEFLTPGTLPYQGTSHTYFSLRGPPFLS